MTAKRVAIVLKIPPQTEPIYVVVEDDADQDECVRYFAYADGNSGCEENAFTKTSAVFYGRARHQHQAELIGELPKLIEEYDDDEDIADDIADLEADRDGSWEGGWA